MSMPTGGETTAATSYPTLHLRSGREFSVLNGHPWVFSGAFRDLNHDAHSIPPGAVVDLISSRDEWVARGHLNAHNSLAFRLLTHDRAEPIDEEFYIRRIQRALRLRSLLPDDVTAYRLIHAEADYLPGLIIDRYDRWLVCQFHTAGVERQRAEIIAALRQALEPEGILARDDIRVREREGLVAGGAALEQGSVPETLEVIENGVHYLVDPWHGQKTGFFLDQRDKRATIGRLATHAQTLLNTFSYSGGFSLAALACNSRLRTVNVDASAAALDLARRNFELNGHDPQHHEFADTDVNRFLQEAMHQKKQFDIVVVDPPAFAKNLAMKERALRGYETLNNQAARVVAQDGLMLTCSCSGGVDYAEFEAAVRQGILRARRDAQIVASFGPSLDHPSVLGFPEDRYLKALLLRLR